MHHQILTITLKYIGDKPFAYRAQDYRIYLLQPQDTLTLPKNHFSNYLLSKPTLFALISESSATQSTSKVEANTEYTETEASKEGETTETTPKAPTETNEAEPTQPEAEQTLPETTQPEAEAESSKPKG